MPSSDVRSSETSAQNARGKNFQKFVFRFSQFRILRFLFSRFGRESRKSRKFGHCENFPLYGMFIQKEVGVILECGPIIWGKEEVGLW